MSLRSWTTAVLLTFAATGCDRGASTGAVSGAQQPSVSFAGGGDARLRVAHSGLRRVSFHPEGEPDVTFRERVTTDGNGHFSVVPVEAVDASVLDWDSFELVQRTLEGFIFRYRDFAIRDPRLFERNWRTTDLGQTFTVASRTCRRYRIERIDGKATVYELSVDVENGMVLASDEFDASGGLRASMTYESLLFAPELSGIAWHQPAKEIQLDPRQELEVARPRKLEPKLLPEGYGLGEAATVEEGGRSWLKRTYTDGVEPLFFLQALDPAPAVSLDPESASRELTASQVYVYRIGSATVIQGKVDGADVIAIGKATEAELLDLLASALPD